MNDQSNEQSNEQSTGETQEPNEPSEAAPPEGGEGPLARAEAEIARLKDVLMRTAADFDNFRKRTRREIDDARRGGKDDLLKELLPVFDNLERALQSAARATDVKAVADGIQMVLRQFGDTLGRAGIQRVPATGQTFDPQIHDAIQQVETNDHPPGTVVAEVQAGYMHGDRLVRPAMVVVSKAKPTDGEPEASPS